MVVPPQDLQSYSVLVWRWGGGGLRGRGFAVHQNTVELQELPPTLDPVASLCVPLLSGAVIVDCLSHLPLLAVHHALSECLAS